jgi:hypothetical protein
LGNVQLLFYWIYYISLWLAPIFLCQCQWFSGLVFWWSLWVPTYHIPFIALEFFIKSFFFFNIYFILSSEILSSTCSTLLEWPSTVFFVWLKGFFIYRISIWFFFLRFSRSTTLLYLVLSSLFHILLLL